MKLGRRKRQSFVKLPKFWFFPRDVQCCKSKALDDVRGSRVVYLAKVRGMNECHLSRHLGICRYDSPKTSQRHLIVQSFRSWSLACDMILDVSDRSEGSLSWTATQCETAEWQLFLLTTPYTETWSVWPHLAIYCTDDLSWATVDVSKSFKAKTTVSNRLHLGILLREGRHCHVA